MAAVSWSGFFGDTVSSSGSYSLIDGRMPRVNAMQRVVHRDGYRTFRALFDQLIGAATGGTASATHARVQAPTSDTIGGARVIETVTDINRTTTAGDVTNLKALVDIVKPAPATYPRDLSGNGGPSFTPVQ